MCCLIFLLMVFLYYLLNSFDIFIMFFFIFILESSYFMIHIPCISAFMSEPGFVFFTFMTGLCTIAFETMSTFKQE